MALFHSIFSGTSYPPTVKPCYAGRIYLAENDDDENLKAKYEELLKKENGKQSDESAGTSEVRPIDLGDFELLEE